MVTAVPMTSGMMARVSRLRRGLVCTSSSTEPMRVNPCEASCASAVLVTACTVPTSEVRRLVRSPVRWLPKKRGESDSRCENSARRRSATTPAPTRASRYACAAPKHAESAKMPNSDSTVRSSGPVSVLPTFRNEASISVPNSRGNTSPSPLEIRVASTPSTKGRR